MSDAATGTVEQWLPTLAFHAHCDARQWASAIADTVAGALRDRLRQDARPRLLVSGGGTPAPVFGALSQAALEWHQVDVGLVDDRWVPATDPGSNARLVRETLLLHAARDAHFDPLVPPDGTIDDAVDRANLHAARPDIVLLGMGDDGHTASLFPGMQGLDAALASPRAYVAVDATGCPGAGHWSRRISLTPAGLAPAATRLLLLRGDGKRALLERVAGGTDPHVYPVRVAFTTPGAMLHVHWCP